jgi:hypothetical protein
MIVKNDTPKTSNIFTAFILLCSIGSIYGVWYTLPFLNSWKIEGTIHCDAEMVRGNKFISHGDYFFNAKSQSNEEAFAGEFSSKIGTGEGFQYGLGINFNQFHPGRSYLISVWRKIGTKTGKSALVIMDKNKNFYFEIDKSVKEKNGWELLEKKITIPFQK